jgi:2-polyprenyl-6-methoxyphenol hydroxylase-like FAD-dependent oxidoreductase
MPTFTHDVLVVGAGPAGLTTAISLARHGVDVLVVEKHAGTSPFPKATGVSTRTVELLRVWGLEDRVRSGALRVEHTMAVSGTLTGPVVATLPFGYPTADQALAVSPTTPLACPQDHLEPVLRDHLLECGGQIRFDTVLTDVTTDDTGVTAALHEPVTDRWYHVRARYVVSADGPRSSVRSALGIGVEDLGTIGDFVSVTFRADLTRRLGRTPSAINAVQAAGAEGMFVPTGTDDRWIYAREWHPERGEAFADWTPQRCVELIRAGTGLDDLCPEILSVLPFVMGGNVADTFRVGRGFIVGDAAHRTTPVGTLGMNTAIHAAHNLGWKLAWVLRGWAGEALLDSYEIERRPIGTDNVLRSLRRAPETEGDGLAWDVGVHYASAVLDAVAGMRAPHAWIRRDGRRISTLDLFDGRLTLLTGRRAGPWRRAAATIAAAGPPITVLSVGRELHDDDGTFADRYALGDTGAALVRPDGYVAWRSSAPPAEAAADLRRGVDLVLGRPAPLLAEAG